MKPMKDRVEGLENPMESLANLMLNSSRDWAADPTDAWIYAIVIGWGEDDEIDSWADIAEMHSLDPATIDRLKRLHEKWQRIAEATWMASTDWSALEADLRELERINPAVKAAADRVDEALRRPDVARFLRGEA